MSDHSNIDNEGDWTILSYFRGDSATPSIVLGDLSIPSRVVTRERGLKYFKTKIDDMDEQSRFKEMHGIWIPHTSISKSILILPLRYFEGLIHVKDFELWSDQWKTENDV